jgi:opacity protein-like surface antigen
MVRTIPSRRWLQIAAAAALFSAILPRAAHAQGFISPSYGYNFGGDTGCRTATDCRNKNWNWGGSLGVLGSIVGFEAELTHEGEFTGDASTRTSVTTLMGNFLVCPRITIVQPYGLVGIGAIRTKVDNRVAAVSDSKDQFGWTIGGGVIVFVQKHVGLKGDVRYYHSVQPLGLLGFELGDENKIDFGRAGFGVVFRF